MASNYITLKIDGARATIALNRPDQHNKLGVEELDTLVATLDHVENLPDCRVLVLTGTGSKTFCSGFDIDQISTTDWTLDPFERAVTRLEQLPIPTICAFNGSVYGGGTELALACDFRIGLKGMRLHLPAAEIGVHYGVKGLHRFYSRLGLGAAKRILLAAERIGSEELLLIGYLDLLVESENLYDETDKLAQRLTTLAPLAVRGMKQALNRIAHGNLDESAVQKTIAQCFASADLSEGITAKSEKRAPKFIGR